jgi:3-dehydroquinate synthetase
MLTQPQFLGTSGHQIRHLLEELLDFEQAHFECVSAWGVVLVKAAHIEDVPED